MSTLHRDIRARSERGKSLLQTLHRNELERAGAARRAAFSEAESQRALISRLLPGAVDAGLSLSEIARVTGVSRPTLYEALKGANGSVDHELITLTALSAGPRGVREI